MFVHNFVRSIFDIHHAHVNSHALLEYVVIKGKTCKVMTNKWMQRKGMDILRVEGERYRHQPRQEDWLGKFGCIVREHTSERQGMRKRMMKTIMKWDQSWVDPLVFWNLLFPQTFLNVPYYMLPRALLSIEDSELLLHLNGCVHLSTTPPIPQCVISGVDIMT